MKYNTVQGSMVLGLFTSAAPFGLLAAALYWLMQPTVLPNPGIAALKLRPQPSVSRSLTAEDQQRMEQAELEEAAHANDGDLMAALASFDQPEQRRKQAAVVSPYATP